MPLKLFKTAEHRQQNREGAKEPQERGREEVTPEGVEEYDEEEDMSFMADLLAGFPVPPTHIPYPHITPTASSRVHDSDATIRRTRPSPLNQPTQSKSSHRAGPASDRQYEHTGE